MSISSSCRSRCAERVVKTRHTDVASGADEGDDEDDGLRLPPLALLP